jgi:predicted ribosomally synthesized peptide with SipW-like signal peptide
VLSYLNTSDFSSSAQTPNYVVVMGAKPRISARGEQGSLLLEVVLAVFVLAVGLLATLAALNDSDHLNATTQRQQAAATIAEQQMEQLRSMSYASLGLSSVPVHATDGNGTGDTSGNPINPFYWVSGSNLLIEQNWNSESSTTSAGTSSSGEALISGGTISPGPDAVTANGYTATVYRFVSWVNDTCSLNSTDLCPSTQDAKRVTVAVVLGTGGGGTAKPAWLDSIVANPAA